MKRTLLSLLTCPQCHNSFEVCGDNTDSPEITEGMLLCSGCGSSFPIVRGIPRFLANTLAADKQATADAFGYEWTHYSKLTDADRREFLDWISPLTPADFEDRVVLDAGCGKGRHIFLAAQFKARTVVGIDLSNAVEAAHQNTRDLPNVHVIQADIFNLPFAQPFDLAYSIGVLHHLPVPKEGFLALASHVKPGGRISAWVYGKEGNLWIEKLVDPVRKNVTSRLPRSITRCLAFFPAVVLYAALKLLYRPAKRAAWLKRLLPYSDYLCSISDYSFSENFWNVFDQLVAPTAFYHSQEEFVDWFQSAHTTDVKISRHNNNSWRGTALMPMDRT
ncbi:MAG TPA: methyltransferase domain-containing protein [Terriglobales bacterium]